MRPANTLHRFASLSLIWLLAGACSRATPTVELTPIPTIPAVAPSPIPPTSAPTTIPPTETATPLFSVTTDLAYASPTQSDKPAWLLDVYVPAAPADLPSVVIFGGMGLSKEGYGYQVLAQSLAEEGAVVFLPNLSPDGSGLDLFRAENGIGLREELEAVVCAVRFARAKTGEYGATSERILAIGHSGGGWNGIMAALVGDEMEAVWDAFAETRGGPPMQMECVEGQSLSGRADIFLGYAGAYTYFYQVENEDPALFQLAHPPTYVGRNTDVVLRFVEAKPDENPTHQQVALLNVEFFENLRAAGYDITVTAADTGYGMEAPSREVVMQEWRRMFKP